LAGTVLGTKPFENVIVNETKETLLEVSEKMVLDIPKDDLMHLRWI